MKKLVFNVSRRTASLVSEKHLSEAEEAFSFSVPTARYTPHHKIWLQQKALGIPEDERQGWNGKKSFMSKDGKIQVGLLLGAKKELEKVGYELVIKEWVNRPSIMPVKGFVENNKDYEYQNECNEKMLKCIPNGGGLVLSATGSGKTKIAAQFFSWLPDNCLFVVDQIDLLYQSQKEIKMWLTQEGYDADVGVVGNGKYEPGRITIATIQTLHKHANKTSFRKWLKTIDIVLIDELHKQMSRRNFGVIDLIKPQAVIGLTATMQMGRKPIRFKCWSICGPTIFEFPIEKAVEAGVVSPGVVVQVPVERNPEPRKIRLVKYKDKNGIAKQKKEPVDDYMHEAVYNKNSHKLVTGLVQECNKQNLCVVVLVERIRHLKVLNARLEKLDLTPKLFYGEVTSKIRRKQLKHFDAGKEDIILANAVFTKGINLKRIDVVIDAAQRSSRNDCIQKYGRAARLHAEKAGIYYIDVYTEGKLLTAAKNRRGAFKKQKIPIEVMDIDYWEGEKAEPKKVLDKCDSMLTLILRRRKDKPTQGRLF